MPTRCAAERRGWRPGWSASESGWTRRFQDDEIGAQIQIAVVRYYLTNYTRVDVARDLCISERQAQAYVNGRAWSAYTRPVLAALRRLGISEQRGSWRSTGVGPRPREVVRAQADVLRRCRDLLGGAHYTPLAIDELQADLRLLSLVDETP
jgi:hypothetical protein